MNIDEMKEIAWTLDGHPSVTSHPSGVVVFRWTIAIERALERDDKARLEYLYSAMKEAVRELPSCH